MVGLTISIGNKGEFSNSLAIKLKHILKIVFRGQFSMLQRMADEPSDNVVLSY